MDGTDNSPVTPDEPARGRAESLFAHAEASISEDAIVAVPQSYRQGSYALGATMWETIGFFGS